MSKNIHLQMRFFFCHLIRKVFCHLDTLRQCLAFIFWQGSWEEARMSKSFPDLCKWIFFAISTFAIIEEIASTQSLFPFLFSRIFLPSWLVADNFQIWQIGDQLLTFFDLNTAAEGSRRKNYDEKNKNIRISSRFEFQVVNIDQNGTLTSFLKIVNTDSKFQCNFLV